MTDLWNRLVPPAAPVSAHLGDDRLMAAELTTVEDKHVAECAWCRGRLDAVSDSDRDELDSLLSELDVVAIPEVTGAQVQKWSMPTSLSHYLAVASASMPKVAPAQLWRLSWHQTNTLAVVVDQDSWCATVAPLTSDVDLADEYTMLLEPAATSLSEPSAVFLRASATVPLFTFERYLGTVEPAGVPEPAHALQRLLGMSMRGAKNTNAGVQTGPDLRVDDWDRHEALDALSALMECFGSAACEVLDDDGEILGGSAEQDGVTDALTLLRESREDLRTLVVGTGLAAHRLLDLRKGTAQPTADEREGLSRHFGQSVAGSHSDESRQALLEVVAQPVYRALWDGPSAGEFDRFEQVDQSDAHRERLRPLLEKLLSQSIAARSVTPSHDDEPVDARSQWHSYWEDRLAMYDAGRPGR